MNVKRRYANATGAAICTRAAWWISGDSLEQRQAHQILIDCGRRAGSSSTLEFWGDEDFDLYEMTIAEMAAEREGFRKDIGEIIDVLGEQKLCFLPHTAVGR